MALYSTTFSELIERVYRLVGDWAEGTATGGSTTTIIDTTNRLEQDDYWNDLNAFAWVHDGAAAGDWRKVTDFVNSSATLTVPTMTSTGVAATNTYSLHSMFTIDEVKKAINMAIDQVAGECLEHELDQATITLAASTYEYALPSDCLVLYGVTQANAAGTWGSEDRVPADEWRILKDGSPKLHLIRYPEALKFEGHFTQNLFADSFTAGRVLQLEYLKRATALSALTDTTFISPAYLMFQAAAFLHISTVRRPDNEPEDHRTQYDVLQKAANIERQRVVSTKLPMNSKKVY